MIRKNKNFSSILILVVFFLLAVASSPKNMSFRDFDKWVPKDFDPNTSILLIQKHIANDKQNAKMIAFLEKKYPYRYEIVGAGPIFAPTGKYEDRSIYKYAIVWKLEDYYNASAKETYIDLYGNFYNLSTREKSKTTIYGRNFGYNGYVPFFNSIIKKFKQKE